MQESNDDSGLHAECKIHQKGSLYAHTGPDKEDDSSWQLLPDHLNKVAQLSSSFAEKFGMAAWGWTLGVLHDAGKASEAFQQRLVGEYGKVDHSTAGAKIAIERYGEANGRLLAYALVGHHGGMPNGTVGGRRTPLEARLRSEIEPYSRFYELVSEGAVALPDKNDLGCPIIPDKDWPKGDAELLCRSFSFFVLSRMLYSSLVDGDYLDTERAMAPEVAKVRKNSDFAEISDLRFMLDSYLKAKASVDSPVNRARQAVLADCLSSAEKDPGIFSLTVPTGGGKTLSSLAFALKHAELYGMEKVIICIPFTSIVEQTADILKNIFGSQNVLEHHSNCDLSDKNDENLAYRLATQNWDAPIIVTTNVQFFESFFSNAPGKSRKVHNMARSVVILDEAQTLPDGLLRPSLAMLEELVRGYRSSVVLCTATQPALDMVWPFGTAPCEIAQLSANTSRLAFGSRVEYQWLGLQEHDSLVSSLLKENQLLCVVGTRKAAQEIYRSLVERAVSTGIFDEESFAAEQGFFHLSANMTPVHRSRVLCSIRSRLNKGERCCVISTQLIEAGVDVDFPIVYRELAGVDSIVQAAGRCNREGCQEKGFVKIFEYTVDGEVTKTTPWLQKMKDITRMLIKDREGVVDDSLVKEFFETRYRSENLDEKNIFRDLSSKSIWLDCFTGIPFESVADSYVIIKDESVPLFVPAGEDALVELENILAGSSSSSSIVRAQRYSVSVSYPVIQKLQEAGALSDLEIPLYVLREECVADWYRSDVGLFVSDEINNKLLFY